MPTSISDGSVTTDGTEQTLVTDTTNKVYVFAIDCGAMVDGDEIEIKIKTIVRASGTERNAFYANYVNAQGAPIKYSEPIPADISCKVTIKRLAGTDRAYPWKLMSV